MANRGAGSGDSAAPGELHAVFRDGTARLERSGSVARSSLRLVRHVLRSFDLRPGTELRHLLKKGVSIGNPILSRIKFPLIIMLAIIVI
ncbi:hypothetical protein IE4872_CH01627 [Rhizobium gallicum]|uniref:Uncharacterized protein n=1 Tax=Rhizobium gallicum TaxID=56730 RepID=A0A1L5NHE1_9HYPH|nr:hypothetical protein IE4872_CH01627 [Rhizobium gallicum]